MFCLRNGYCTSKRLVNTLKCRVSTNIKPVSANNNYNQSYHHAQAPLTTFNLINRDKVCHYHQPQHQLVRQFFSWPNPFRKRQDFGKIDKVPEDYQCIYVSPVNIYIVYIYPLCAFTSLATLALTTYHTFLADPGSVLNIRSVRPGYSGTFSKTQLIFGTTFSAVLGLIVWRFSRKTPLRIYYNEDEDKFILAFPTVLPWKTILFECKPGDVVHMYPSDPEITSITLDFSGEYVLKGKGRIVLNPEKFAQPFFYNNLIGIQDLGSNREFD